MTASDWEIFRINAIKAVGLEGHPLANETYSWCWRVFGSWGKDEVLCALADLAETILEGQC
jgi:hypothetical protein